MKNIEVCAAIILKDNKILITQRGYGEFKGYFEFPGGKKEINETNEQCLIREIKEELDADIEIINYLNTIEYDYPTFHLKMNNYICKLKSDHLLLLEHESLKFITIDEINNINFLPADILIFDDLIKYIKLL